MKRTQRINRVTRKRPPRSRRFVLIAAILAAGALLLQVVFVGLVFTAAGAGAFSYYNHTATLGLARLRQAPTLQDVQPTRILDRKGRLLLQISDTSRGLHQNVPLSKIPRYMKEAIIATENKTFYSDPGVDPKSLGRAILTDLRYHGAIQGASTITQQVVKRLVLNSQPGWQRKLQEIMIAYAVARPRSGFSKNEILSLYLNTDFFGHEATGVEAAARVFFGKHIWQLDLAQCALLAGLVQAPTYYDPLGAWGPEPSKQRMRTTVLPRMLAERYITTAQEQQAIAEGNKFVFSYPQWSLTSTRSLAPYWTDWIQHLLTYGVVQDPSWYTDPTLAAIMQRAGGLSNGLTIRTTLDLDMYRQAQAIMNQKVALLAGQNVSDAAVVTLDPHSSECLAMVGGLDYYSKQSGSLYNFGAYPRSPGSSFKLFTYLTAFEQGWYPAKMILDEAQTWPDSSAPSGVYAPTNYDKSWHGAVTVRMALANSYNMPAVKTIAAVGVDNVLKTAADMGVWYLRGKSAGLSLTLGAKAVPLWQMAQAYNTVANGGVFRQMASILSIKDADGATLYTYHTPAGRQVIAPQYAYLMTSILSDNFARVPAFGANSSLQLGPDAGSSVNLPAAVKTGTSQEFRDNLTIGYTPNLLTATWVGNANDKPMLNVEGVDGAGPIWHDFMEWAHTYLNLPVTDFSSPPGIVLARVSSSGYLASQYTAWPLTDLFAAGAVPHQYDAGYGDTYTHYRVLPYNFSVDGGTLGSSLSGSVLLTPIAGGTPGAGIPPPGATPPAAPNAQSNGSVPSGFSGTLQQRPSNNANLCGGRYYTYYPVTVNGQLVWRYVCQ